MNNETPDFDATPIKLIGRLAKWLKLSPTWAAIFVIGESVAKIAIFYSIAVYLLQSDERLKIKQFQAWQVLNSAHSGDGGRTLALHDLIESHADLSRVDLSGANLSKTNLCGGNFSRADFRKANLTETSFSCVHSSKKDSSIYDMHPRFTTHLTDLNDANFQDSSLYSTDFSDTDISFNGFSKTDGTQFEFYDVRFDDTQFTNPIKNAVFKGSSFIAARIIQSSFRAVDFYSTLFVNASIFSVSFENVHFYRLDSHDSEVMARQIIRRNKGLVDPPVDFTGAEFGDDVTWNGHPIRESDLTGAVLCRTTIRGKISNRDC